MEDSDKLSMEQIRAFLEASGEGAFKPGSGDNYGTGGCLDVQDKLRVVGQFTVEVHGPKIGIELQDCVPGSTRKVHVPFVAECQAAGILHVHSRNH
jgi:hypothetical protein